MPGYFALLENCYIKWSKNVISIHLFRSKFKKNVQGLFVSRQELVTDFSGFDPEKS